MQSLTTLECLVLGFILYFSTILFSHLPFTPTSFLFFFLSLSLSLAFLFLSILIYHGIQYQRKLETYYYVCSIVLCSIEGLEFNNNLMIYLGYSIIDSYLYYQQTICLDVWWVNKQKLLSKNMIFPIPLNQDSLCPFSIFKYFVKYFLFILLNKCWIILDSFLNWLLVAILWYDDYKFINFSCILHTSH